VGGERTGQRRIPAGNVDRGRTHTRPHVAPGLPHGRWPDGPEQWAGKALLSMSNRWTPW
jgi:hypothetical protein